MLWGGGATAASTSAPTASTARTADSMRFDERLIPSVTEIFIFSTAPIITVFRTIHLQIQEDERK